jgi:hypothetical protein
MTTPELIYVRDLDEVDEHRVTHSRRVRSGRAVRLARGAYVGASEWAALDRPSQYRMRIRATADTRRTDMVLSHWSAAAMHRLPILGQWPREVHFTVGRVSGGRSRNEVAKHALELDDADVVHVGGLAVTSLARTVLDMTVTADRLTAAMVVDRALMVDRFASAPTLAIRDDLWAAFERRGSFRGAKRAENFICFGTTRAESPLESVSRWNTRTIGCPTPLLQTPFYDANGYIGDGDFDWPFYRLVGEADGKAKYLDAAMLNGRTTSEALIAEKTREDRIRATGERFSRWPWAIGVDPSALRTHLRAAGLPIP